MANIGIGELKGLIEHSAKEIIRFQSQGDDMARYHTGKYDAYRRVLKTCTGKDYDPLKGMGRK